MNQCISLWSSVMHTTDTQCIWSASVGCKEAPLQELQIWFVRVEIAKEEKKWNPYGCEVMESGKTEEKKKDINVADIPNLF